MTSLDDDQIRLAMLEILHNKEKEEPGGFGIGRNELKEFLGIDAKRMDFNMLYLEQKWLVKLLKTMGSLWEFATITALGMDVVEHKEKFADKLPFTQATISIQGNMYGDIVQAIGSTVNFNQKITDGFKKAYDAVENKADIAPDQKAVINANLKELEGELKKPKPDAGKIQKGWNWINTNANWVVPIIATIVLEGTKLALGL
jgi:hypothetical protein